MKNLLTLACCTLSFLAFAQNNAVLDFIDEHRRGEDNFALKIPAWVFGLAGEGTQFTADDPEAQVILDLAREVGTTRILAFQNHDFDSKRDVRRLFGDLENHHDFSTWASLRTPDGQRLQLSVRMKKDRIRELVAVITDSETTFFLHANTRFTAEELSAVLEEVL